MLSKKNPTRMKYEMLTDFKIMSNSRLARISAPIICTRAQVLMSAPAGC